MSHTFSTVSQFYCASKWDKNREKNGRTSFLWNIQYANPYMHGRALKFPIDWCIGLWTEYFSKRSRPRFRLYLRVCTVCKLQTLLQVVVRKFLCEFLCEEGCLLTDHAAVATARAIRVAVQWYYRTGSIRYYSTSRSVSAASFLIFQLWDSFKFVCVAE